MTSFPRYLIKLISSQIPCLLIILSVISLTGLIAAPSSACCYDPPDYNDRAEQVEPPAADLPVEEGQESLAVPQLPEEAQIPLYSAEPSDQQDLSSAGIYGEKFLLIKRFMADGQYLRAKQMAENRLMSRPFDHKLWTLLETIYRKMGLQNKTRKAATNAKVMDPRWRPPSQPASPMSRQKQYVSRLLEAIGEYKPVE